MARIGFAITDVTGGGAWYRGLFPARLLRSLGHEVVAADTLRYGPRWELGFDLREGFIDNPQELAGELYTDEAGTEGEVWCPDVMVLTAGWVMGILEMLELGRMSGAGEMGRNVSQVLAVDFDDGLEPPRDNAGWRPRQVEFKLAATQAADRIVCATPMIARDLALTKRPTRVVRNVTDPSRFADVAEQNLERLEHDRTGRHFMEMDPEPVPYAEDDRLALGYRGPMPWHRADIEELAKWARRAVDELNCYWIHIGARPDDPVTFAELVGIEYAEARAHTPFATYPGNLFGVDVGIISFARRRWSTGKSNIGALEWNAAGVPWLASDVPEYRKLHSASTVSSPFGWIRHLERLTSAKARRDLFDRQRVRSAELYADEAGLHWRAALEWAKALGVEELELSAGELLREHGLDL